jgi:hypothetical protein
MDENCITYQIDKENRLIFLSDEWYPFAQQNKAAHLTREMVLNKSMFVFVTDRQCQHLYQILIENAKQSKRILKFHFRCDSPDRRRFMRMEIFACADESLFFKSCLLREELREPVLLLDADANRSDEFLIICSWCKKVMIDAQEWAEVEAAIEKLELFNTEKLPGLSHGICPKCYEEILMAPL